MGGGVGTSGVDGPLPLENAAMVWYGMGCPNEKMDADKIIKTSLIHT